MDCPRSLSDQINCTYSARTSDVAMRRIIPVKRLVTKVATQGCVKKKAFHHVQNMCMNLNAVTPLFRFPLSSVTPLDRCAKYGVAPFHPSTLCHQLRSNLHGHGRQTSVITNYSPWCHSTLSTTLIARKHAAASMLSGQCRVDVGAFPWPISPPKSLQCRLCDDEAAYTSIDELYDHSVAVHLPKPSSVILPIDASSARGNNASSGGCFYGGRCEETQADSSQGVEYVIQQRQARRPKQERAETRSPARAQKRSPPPSAKAPHS